MVGKACCLLHPYVFDRKLSVIAHEDTYLITPAIQGRSFESGIWSLLFLICMFTQVMHNDVSLNRCLHLQYHYIYMATFIFKKLMC